MKQQMDFLKRKLYPFAYMHDILEGILCLKT